MDPGKGWHPHPEQDIKIMKSTLPGCQGLCASALQFQEICHSVLVLLFSCACIFSPELLLCSERPKLFWSLKTSPSTAERTSWSKNVTEFIQKELVFCLKKKSSFLWGDSFCASIFLHQQLSSEVWCLRTSRTSPTEPYWIFVWAAQWKILVEIWYHCAVCNLSFPFGDTHCKNQC